MGLRGPAPQPTALRVMRGNPGKRPLPTNEPQFEALNTGQIRRRVPPDMPEPARKWWAYYAGIFGPFRVVTAADLVMLGHLAQATADRISYESQVAKAGPLYKAPETGRVLISPLYKLMAQAREREYRLLREFGSSPSSRTAVKTAGNAAPADDAWGNLG